MVFQIVESVCQQGRKSYRFLRAGRRRCAALMGPLAGTLAAISMGAVYMGALTYIGNAPNFMVYAIAQERGIRMPSFFGYTDVGGADPGAAVRAAHAAAGRTHSQVVLTASHRCRTLRRGNFRVGTNDRARGFQRLFRPEPDVGLDRHPGRHLRGHHVGEDQPRHHRADRRQPR